MPSPRHTMWSRFLTITSPFFRSELRWLGLGLLGLILGFICCLGGLNVLGSFMNERFMTAVGHRDGRRLFSSAALWAGVFVLLTVVAAFKAFTEERLRLMWRRWLTRHLMNRYLADRAYYHLKARADVDNPDQRISEDVKTFTDHALALLLIFTNSTIALLSFSVVLWLITPWLFLAAILYALFGSLMTVFLGRRLVRLDIHQFKKEADLRYDLIHLRSNAEPVALLGSEGAEKRHLLGRLDSAVENMKGIIGLSRNINFFTMGYDYLILLLPLAIVAPLYVRGDVKELGQVTQAQMAFLHVMGAFSLVVKEFQRISAFGAVVERLGGFCEALDQERPGPTGTPPIESAVDGSRVAFENLTLLTPRDGRVLISDLTVSVPRGQRLLVLGPKGSGRTALVRALAGLWTSGRGRVVRPPLEEIVFLPQQPYLKAGSLREQLCYAARNENAGDEELLAALRAVELDGVLERAGGLDAEQDWPTTLSVGEQQQVALARLLLAHPTFACLDESTSAMPAARAHRLYEKLRGTTITYLSLASDPRLREFHDLLVELGPDGTWRSPPTFRAVSA